MVVTGVVGVVRPLDLPDIQVGDSENADDANDGLRSEFMSYDEKLSDVNEGQSRGDDSEEKLSQLVSSAGRCESNAEPTVAIAYGSLVRCIARGKCQVGRRDM
jgi:hypothetical protein